MSPFIILFGIINGILSSIFSAGLPVMYANIIHTLANGEDINIDNMILSYLLYKVIANFTASLRGGSFSYFIHQATNYTKLEIMDKIKYLKLDFFDKNNNTETSELITSHIENVSDLFILNTNVAIRTLTHAIVTYIITAKISFNLSILLILLCFLQISVQTYYYDFIYVKIVNAMNKEKTEQHKYINDYIQYIDTYKATGVESKFYKNFYDTQNNITQFKQKESLHYAINMFVSDTINTFIVFVLLFYSIYYENTPRKDIHIFLLYIDTYMHIMGSIKYIYTHIVQHKDSIKKIKDFWKNSKDIQRYFYIPSSPEKFEPFISFQNVDFSYKDDKNVLSDFNLDIPFGSKIGFFGKSGIGKSTIIKLILKLYDIKRGRLTINDISLKYYDSDWYYENMISYVGQENPILIDNKIGEHDKTDLQKDFLKDIDIDSSKMSGGQKQRLSIFKCLLHNTPIIIMDEPTASLDNKNKELFIDVMNEYTSINKQYTLILVSHDRYLLEKLCDRVIEL